MIRRVRGIILLATIATLIFAVRPPHACADRRDDIAAELRRLDKKISDAEAMQSAINRSPGDYADVPQTLAVLADTVAKLKSSRDALLRERDTLPDATPQTISTPSEPDAVNEVSAPDMEFFNHYRTHWTFKSNPKQFAYADTHFARGVTYLNAGFYALDPIVQSTILMHESAHANPRNYYLTMEDYWINRWLDRPSAQELNAFRLQQTYILQLLQNKDHALTPPQIRALNDMERIVRHYLSNPSELRRSVYGRPHTERP